MYRRSGGIQWTGTVVCLALWEMGDAGGDSSMHQNVSALAIQDSLRAMKNHMYLGPERRESGDEYFSSQEDDHLINPFFKLEQCILYGMY